MTLPPEEPEFSPWQVISLQEFSQSIQNELLEALGRPSVLAIDGRSGSGKSTPAGMIQQTVLGSVVVRTDDIPSSGNWQAREEAATTLGKTPSLFDWMERLLKNVLEPAHTGLAVRYRPQAWDDWKRPHDSAIEVPLGCPMLILEGVGAARHELMHLIDVVVWVQSDLEQAQARGIARDGGGAEALALWDAWNAQEFPFQAQQKPWERVNFVVCGTPNIEHDPVSEIVVAAFDPQKPDRPNS